MKFPKQTSLILFIAIIILINGCASTGLLRDTYDPEFYQMPSLMPENKLDHNPEFIVYGDSQPAWRLQVKFATAGIWTSKKMWFFPFYQLYAFGQGIYGLGNFILNRPDYGSDTREMMRDVVYSACKKNNYDFILNTGDIMGQDGRVPEHWKYLLDDYNLEHPILKEIPYLPTVGNHERKHDKKYGSQNYEAVWDYPSFYTVEFPDAELFVIDSNIMIDFRNDLKNAEQDSLYRVWLFSGNPNKPAWLETELVDCNKKFKIVSMHQCPFSYNWHWKDWYKRRYGPDLLTKKAELVNLFKENGVQVVFSGHDHIYQRNVLHYEKNENFPRDNIQFLVSSGAGTTIRPANSFRKREKLRNMYSEDGYNVTHDSHVSAYHYTVVSIDPNKMAIRTFGIPIDNPEEEYLIDEVVFSD